MSDKHRESIIRILAFGYAICLLTLLFSAFLPGKDFGFFLLITLFPISTVIYLVAYRLICKGYTDSTKRSISFSAYGGGTLEGILYRVSSGFFMLIVFFLVTYAFDSNNN